MNTLFRFAALSALATAATLAAASPVPLLTGDALRDEALVMQAANHKLMTQPMSAQMVRATVANTPVQQYQFTGDGLTDEKLFAQQAQARRQMAARTAVVASATPGLSGTKLQ